MRGEVRAFDRMACPCVVRCVAEVVVVRRASEAGGVSLTRARRVNGCSRSKSVAPGKRGAREGDRTNAWVARAAAKPRG